MHTNNLPFYCKIIILLLLFSHCHGRLFLSILVFINKTNQCKIGSTIKTMNMFKTKYSCV